jgi:hypothetical protein
MRRMSLIAILAITATVSANANSLPSGWSAGIFGDGGLDTVSTWNYVNEAGPCTITTSGDDIWSIKDLGTFVYLEVSGDITITAHVASLANTHEWAKAGVMIRQDMSFGSANAFAGGTISHGTTFTYRPTAVVNTISNGEVGPNVPTWVRLRRTGNQYYAYYSSDGVNWTSLPGTPQTGITMSDPCFIGLAASSHTVYTDTTAVFR